MHIYIYIYGYKFILTYHYQKVLNGDTQIESYATNQGIQ